MQDRQESSDPTDDAMRLWPDFAEALGLDYAYTLQLVEEFGFPTVLIEGEVFLKNCLLREATLKFAQISRLLKSIGMFPTELEG